MEDFTVVSVTECDADTEVSEEHRDAIYRVTLPNEIDTAEQFEEGTVASEIAGEESVIAVTFDTECAEEYPSLRFLLPGDPIFEQLVDRVCSVTGGGVFEWVQFGYDRASNDPVVGGEPWIVGDILDDGYGLVLSEGGCVADTPIDTDYLEEWTREFVQNRDPDSL